MASSFANVASTTGSGRSPQPGIQLRDGDELAEIQTGRLGFKTINAETKLKLLPSPWPSEDPPIPTAQLLSVASSQGILAAAGPDVLIIASTDQIRGTLSASEGDNIRDTRPILAIPHDRLTHVAFSSDESVLVISGPGTGGLIAYQVDNLKAGKPDIALHISANTALRALVPNPNPQSAYLFATVDADGQLLIADLSMGTYVEGAEGKTLAKDVTCVSWSNKGKQLVAGLTTGNAIQLKPNGTAVAHLPKSTSIPDENHVSTISWLEDDTFLVIYTPNLTSAEEGIPPSEYCIVERAEKTNYTFHRMPEVLPLFGVERLPTYHFISRLRRFEPHLTDLLLLSATTATDVGIISKSSQPLSTSDNAADLVANKYTVTALEDDTRRAALPLSESSLDTSPIGMAIDLSSKEPVINPLPSDPELQETAGPVPNLLVLNNEGLLCSWWIIYTDSIQQKTTYSGFESLSTIEQIRSAVSAPAGKESTPAIASENATGSSQTAPDASLPFQQPTMASAAASSSPFAAPASQSNLNAPKIPNSLQSGFGTGNSFGIASKIGDSKSSWTSTGFTSVSNTSSNGPTFGQSSFGQPTFGTPSAVSSGSTPAFGATSGLVNRPISFGQAASPAFGKTSFGTPPATGSLAGGSGSGSGFASFASSGGFGGVSHKPDESKASPFTKPAITGGFGLFGQTSKSESPFSKTSSSSGFGQASTNGTFGTGQGFGGFGSGTAGNSMTSFGTGSAFKIESSFKGDGTAKDDLSPPAGGSSFGFGSSLGNILTTSKKDVPSAPDTETEMDDDKEDQESVSADEKERPFGGFSPPEKQPSGDQARSFITPPSTINQSKVTQAAPVSGLFGPPQQQTTTTTPQQPFTGLSFNSTTPKETPAASRTLFGTNPVSATTPAMVQKSEPVKAFNAVGDAHGSDRKETTDNKKTDVAQNSTAKLANKSTTKTLEPPLPPDPISKPAHTTGDTSASSANSKVSTEPEDAPLPPDFLNVGKSPQKGVQNVQISSKTPPSPDFLPANRSATVRAEESQLPDDDDEEEEEEEDAEDDEFSSDFEGSGEDITEEISPVEGEDEATTEQIQTSPESSFRGGDTTSPTGGLFTKVSTNDASRSARPLFGEVGSSVPLFPPPKPQQSPRSPSPVRRVPPHESLRHDNRSVSTPLQSQSAINQRKSEYSQSAIAAQAARAREEEAARERARLQALKMKTQEVEASQLQTLEDEEDERLQRELAAPVQPSRNLDEFITYQARAFGESHKADIPSQIERLYQDINSMICTLGINARSLSAFLMYQQEPSGNPNLLEALQSEAPLEAISTKRSLGDIQRLPEGIQLLTDGVAQHEVQGVAQKLETCQGLITRELFDLRTKITAIRKSLYAKSHGSTSAAPLSAEQASIQHDLRKASASVQTSLVQLEDTLAMVKARLAEVAPTGDTGQGYGTSSSHSSQRKPTVEAVTNTIAKMTSMAEKKSADIDVLEAQLKKLDVSSLGSSVSGGGLAGDVTTPHRSKTSRATGTPSSAASSMFYTPGSNVPGSVKSTRSHGGNVLSAAMVSAEDRDRWQAKLRRKRDVADILRAVLEDKHKTSSATA